MWKLWGTLSEQGVGRGIDMERATRIRLTNQIAITISVAMLPFAVLWYGLGVRLLALVVVPLALVYASILLLNRWGHYRTGVVAYITVFNLMTAVYAAALGSASLLRIVFFRQYCLSLPVQRRARARVALLRHAASHRAVRLLPIRL